MYKEDMYNKQIHTNILTAVVYEKTNKHTTEQPNMYNNK